ncbi:MAG: di-heme oxidoredictase family protein [Pseudomonadota bacterium]
MALVSAACGGGGGGSDNPPPPVAGPADPDPPVPDPDPPSVVPPVLASERFSGGDASTSVSNERAFGQRPEAIEQDFELDGTFTAGNAIFRNDHEGEGPLLNARTCQGCHTRDGRGRVPVDTNTPMDSMSISIGLGTDADDETIEDPNYGSLLQVFGLASFSGGGDVTPGLSRFGGGAGEAIGEGFPFVEYEAVAGAFADGQPYELRKPIYKVRDLSYGDFAAGIQFSPRVAPQVFGLGLLEAVPEADIRAWADPSDSDGDGISGRAAEAFDQATGTTRLGRIGVKAAVPSLLLQNTGAYRADMGVTNSLAPEEDCAPLQTSCIQAALLEPDNNPGGVDISDLELALVEFYVRLLAVPERRGFDEGTDTWDEEVLAGRTLFFEGGCGSCHRQTLTTGTAAGSVLGEVRINALFPDAPPIEVLSDQVIYPYTDLLLHDMGGSCDPIVPERADGSACPSGENCVWVQRCTGLADGRPEGTATGVEWRTAPLWGLGLVQTVNPGATFLHDGRARTISEAILWHGGEAETAKEAYRSMTAPERASLLSFLESL